MSDDTTITEPANKGGRPSKAELDARAAALKQREDDLAARETELELRAAEANATMREAELEKAELRLAASGRSGSARSGTARTEEVTAPMRQRRFHGGDIPNEYHIPEDQIPDGISYQWNNYTVFGMPNPSQDSYMQMQGWVPVPAGRHPHLMMPGADPKAPLIVKGQILVERPRELTIEALNEEYTRATGEVLRKEEQLYGALPNTPGGQKLGIKKTVERANPAELNKLFEGTPGIPVD